jgi:hypothetical protein
MVRHDGTTPTADSAQAKPSGYENPVI